MLLWRQQPTFKGFYIPCSIPAPQHPDTVKGGGPSEDHLQYTQTPAIPHFQLDVQHYCKDPGFLGTFICYMVAWWLASSQIYTSNKAWGLADNCTVNPRRLE